MDLPYFKPQSRRDLPNDKQSIHPDAPKAIGPYSRAVVYGGLLCTSGQIALSPENSMMDGDDISTQAERVMKNLTAADTSFDRVVKTTCFLADMADFAAINKIYAKYITSARLHKAVLP